MSKRFYFLIVEVIIGLLWLSLAPASAQAPSIRVTPVWRPASQLTTIDANSNGITDTGDDIRYVAVEIYATTNVEFWAVGFTCTVNKNVLESYVQNSDPNSTEDDTAMFSVGVDWYAFAHSVDTTDTDGKLNFAIAQSGVWVSPMGSNGVSRTLHIATLRYRVKEGLTTAATSTFACTSSFLNRDGRPVLAAAYGAPAPLSILPGYTLTGKVTYQGTTTVLTAAQAIDIECDDADVDTTFDDVDTTANRTTGLFSVNNLRTQGRYDCRFIGNIRSLGSGPDLHLMGVSDFNLTTTSFALLPVVLVSGNVDTVTYPTGVYFDDTTLVTSNWNAPLSVVTAPYVLGDASGDRKINEADLAIVANNYYRWEPIAAHHLIYSLPRDVKVFQNSHLWLGTYGDTRATPFVAGNTRDYWPAVSPNGARIAFVRNVGIGPNNRYALFTAPITNGVVGAATRITPANATYDAFAPSWSPDGSRIAFVCSYNQQWFGDPTVTTPYGNLCLIDANGLNFRVLYDANGVGSSIQTKIQAPAWLDAQRIYFTFVAKPPVGHNCDNKICILNLQDGLASVTDIPIGADMPYVRNGVLGPTLFYRFDNGAGSRTLRFAQINLTSPWDFATYPNSVSGTIHEDIQDTNSNPFPNGSLPTLSVEYFTVSTGADPDILYYDSYPTIDDAGGTAFVVEFFDGSAAAPSWGNFFNSFQHSVSDAVGNPAFASGFNEALPNTVAFVP